MFYNIFCSLGCFLSLNLAFAESVKEAKNTEKEKYEQLELFQKVLFFVDNNYVESVPKSSLMNGAIKGMLDTLDPHSSFLTPELYRELKTDTQGKFGGVGIEVGLKDGQLTIIAPMEDTPASRAGVKAGDRVIRINEVPIKGLSLAESVSKMRGKKGTDLKLTLSRDGESEVREYTLRREAIKVKAVKGETLEPGFGYIKLSSFNEDTSRDLKKSLDQLSRNGELRGLVLDLRNNPGGLLDQAVEVVSYFIEDELVVSTIGRDPKQKEEKKARHGIARKNLPLAVLVNAGSASASEIVAGALQDHKRALIMGQRTFGKGSVQTIVDLGNEQGLKLTVAKYYTPSGRSIHEKGVEPDIVLDDLDEEALAKLTKKSDSIREADLVRRKRDKEPVIPNSGASSEKISKDYQLQQALNALKSFEFFTKIRQPSGS